MDKKTKKTQWDKLMDSPELHKAHLERRKKTQKSNALNALSLLGVDIDRLGLDSCAAKNCITILNSYNSSVFCSTHENKIVSYSLIDFLRKNHCMYMIKREIKKQSTIQ